jgi:hypothetical protein
MGCVSERCLLLAICLAVASPQSSHAATVEITPFYGYRFSGDFEDAETGDRFDFDDASCTGGMLDIALSEMTQFEFYYSHQDTELRFDSGLLRGESVCDLDVDYYHVGGTYIVVDDRWQPFVVATVGATHLSPDFSGKGSLTRFSLGIGGGVRCILSEHLNVYLACRGLFTFVGGDTLIRSDESGLTVQIDGDGLWQGELQAGLTFAF